MEVEALALGGGFPLFVAEVVVEAFPFDFDFDVAADKGVSSSMSLSPSSAASSAPSSPPSSIATGESTSWGLMPGEASSVVEVAESGEVIIVGGLYPIAPSIILLMPMVFMALIPMAFIIPIAAKS